MTQTKLLIDERGIVQNRIVVGDGYGPADGFVLKDDPNDTVDPEDAYDGVEWHRRPSVPDDAPDGSTVEWTGDEFVIRQPDGTLYDETE